MATDKMAGHYIWLTRGDSKVRASHAERDGTMFSWNKPPQGGHPGQEYNCRCRAIPVTAEHQLPIPAQNPDNPLQYRDLVEFGLITKFNKMTQDRNKFLDADTAADIHEERKKEGMRFKPGTTGMVLARRVNAGDEAAKSAAEFEEAVRDKGLDNKSVDDHSQEKNDSFDDLNEKAVLAAERSAVDKLRAFLINLSKTAVDMTTVLSFQIVDPVAFQALDQFIKLRLEQYEEAGKITREWGEQNPYYYSMLTILEYKSRLGVPSSKKLPGPK